MRKRRAKQPYQGKKTANKGAKQEDKGALASHETLMLAYG
jgi:hypothetical protein